MTTEQNDAVDAYIAQFSKDVQGKLQEIREIVTDTAPQAEEVMSYGMPSIKMKVTLVYYGAFKNHIGFYPTPKPLEVFKEALQEYATSKGAVQFPLDEPIPYDLIREMVKFRLNEVTNQ